MDEADRKILSELQVDGRISLTDLASKLNISLSACHRRVRQLEAAGVIVGYFAQIDPSAAGLEFSALVFVTLNAGDARAVQAIETAISAIPEITQAQRLFGDPDYMLTVVCRDLRSFQILYDQHLLAMPGVQRLTSTLIMKTVVQGRGPFHR